MKKHSQNHSFSVHLAIECGVNASIVYNHLHYWINHNRIAGTAQADGKTWTYQTRQTMQEYLPYLTEKEVRGAIDKLVEFGYVIKGKFNKNKFDQTTWYSLPDSEPCLPGREQTESDDSNNSNETPKRANGMARPVQSTESERANASIYSKDRKEEQQQQQELAAAVVFSTNIYDILKPIEIPEEEKTWLCQAYNEQTIANAIGWATHPDNPPEKCLAASIKFACKKGLSTNDLQMPKKPTLPQTKEVDIDEAMSNKSYAEIWLKKNWKDEKKHGKVHTLVRCDVEYVQVMNDCIYFRDARFKEMFEHSLRKLD